MKKILPRILLSLISVLLTLGTLETAARLWHWEGRFENFLMGEIHWVREAFPAQYHLQLGWIPRPGSWSGKALRDKQVTILADGIRSNGQEELTKNLPGSPLILAVGNSFTFGAEVSDSEAWPAVLERLLGKRVINGGVFGYGLDQSFLRAEALIDTYEPDILILSLIADNIRRCELSQRSGSRKPYFQIRNGRLQLHNQPVLAQESPDFGLFKEVTGYSFFFYKFMRRAFPGYWLEGSLSQTAHIQGEKIACLLVRQMASIMTQKAIHFVLLIQYGRDPLVSSFALIDHLLGCARSEPVRVVDLRADLRVMRRDNPKEYEKMFLLHMSARGNHYVAQVLHEALREYLTSIPDPSREEQPTGKQVLASAKRR